MRLILASGNQHKVAEFRRLLAAAAPAVELLSVTDVGARISFDEGDDSYLNNAMGKATSVYQAVRQPVIADDSGLEVDALGGAPGVLSARYGPPDADDAGRAAHLLRNLETQGEVVRTARFVCCIALVLDERRFLSVQATVEGHIAERASGTGGFGYDPVFVPESETLTMAELEGQRKDAISHRGRALRACLRCVDAATARLLG